MPRRVAYKPAAPGGIRDGLPPDNHTQEQT